MVEAKGEFLAPVQSPILEKLISSKLVMLFLQVKNEEGHESCVVANTEKCAKL